MKVREKTVWTGVYRGVDFEINRFSFEENGKNRWTHYIYLHLDRIPEQYKPKTFWLRGKKDGRHTLYDYLSHPIIVNIEFHGGCTWYSKEHGFDGSSKIIKIGCDYQHLWDEGQSYDLSDIEVGVRESIDSLLNLIEGYKYFCCGNGKLYDLGEGVLINEQFHSFEYWKNHQWFKEKYVKPSGVVQ